MASSKNQVISFVMGSAYDPPPELKGFDNRVIRRKARGEIGGPWWCNNQWVVADKILRYPVLSGSCNHSMLEHDDDGCMWAQCSCERRGRR
jgi:hypothetical protein